MNIKVLIDFDILGDYKTNRKLFDENLETLRMLFKIYGVDLFI